MTRRIVMLCPGLGHVRRGMERSIAGIYDELAGSLDAEWHLWGGAGPKRGLRRALPILARERVPRWVTRLRPRGAVELEQLSFFVSALPELERLAPAAIYCRDELLARLLAVWKRARRPRVRLIYGNGSPIAPPFPRAFDLIQHLTRHGLDMALDAGEPPTRQRYVPNAFHLPAAFAPTLPEDRRALRRALGLPEAARVVLCVAALNRYHKRLDHLVREVARLPDRDVTLVLVGEREAETPALIAEGRAALGERFVVASVAPGELDAWYRAADAFALPSSHEAFGRVIVEALAAGLPVLVHAAPTFAEIAGPHGLLVDMHRAGALAAAFTRPEAWDRDPEAQAARHRRAWERYSWDRLRAAHLELFAAALT